MRHDRKCLFLAASLASASLLASLAFARGPTASPRNRNASAKPTAKPTPAKAAANSCSACIERGAVLDPQLFARGFDPEVKPSYEAARKYPDTMDRIHCFCECKESPREHHKTLLTCFTNEHAAGCGICQREALLAAKLKDQGASDEEVELTVESLYKTQGHPPTYGRGL